MKRDYYNIIAIQSLWSLYWTVSSLPLKDGKALIGLDCFPSLACDELSIKHIVLHGTTCDDSGTIADKTSLPTFPQFLLPQAFCKISKHRHTSRAKSDWNRNIDSLHWSVTVYIYMQRPLPLNNIRISCTYLCTSKRHNHSIKNARY